MYITARSFPIFTRLTARLFSLAVAASALVVLNVGTRAYAQEYPNRPVKMVVPYPPGGGTDIAARWIAGKLSDVLKQTVFVDNLAGANGNLGTDYIAKAAPDGYVIGMATPGPVTVGRVMSACLSTPDISLRCGER